MNVPQTTPLPSIAPLSGVDVTLHEFAGLSWHVLMPYTLLGAGLMTYSQVRLLRGQRAQKRQAYELAKKSTFKSRVQRAREYLSNVDFSPNY